MTVEKAKGAVPQFDIIGPKKKDKMTFKSESAEINSMWVIELQSSILENKPVDNISITEKGTCDFGSCARKQGCMCTISILFTFIVIIELI